MADRRDTLKIIGAIGATCAFPFASDELYGQHVHAPAGAASEYGPPKFFTSEEFATLSRLTDLIIPRTDTPGAVDAGVPHYIDYVVNTNEEWRKLYRQSLAVLQPMTEPQLIDMLVRHIDQPGESLEARFFRALKSMTADGYYTSKIGLTTELGYQGNTVRESYPSCEVEH